MPHILHVPVPPVFIIIFFERQYAQHFINAYFHFLHPVFLPCPNLWRNIVDHFKTFLFGPFGNTEIKAGIVDQHQYIWLPGENILFAEFDILLYENKSDLKRAAIIVKIIEK